MGEDSAARKDLLLNELNACCSSAAQETDGQKDAEVMVGRLNELEGQLLLLEDSVSRKDAELNDLKLRRAAEESERLALKKSQRLNQQALADAEKLRIENAFLSGVVSRFEKKTMGLERQLETLSEVKAQAEAKEKEAAARKEELQVVQAEAEMQQEREHAAALRTSALEQANAESIERLEEQQQAAESAALPLRDYKKEHNQKMQELLRRLQSVEKQK